MEPLVDRGFQAFRQFSGWFVNLHTTHGLYRGAMIQLAYISTAANDLASGDIFKIIEKSARNNGAAELTGFLIFAQGRFFQLIEGPAEAIEGLLARLTDDPRHSNIEVLKRETIQTRAFPKWTMKRVDGALSPVELAHHMPEMDKAPFEIRQAVFDFLAAASIEVEQPAVGLARKRA